jgi:hypothetical protein
MLTVLGPSRPQLPEKVLKTFVLIRQHQKELEVRNKLRLLKATIDWEMTTPTSSASLGDGDGGSGPGSRGTRTGPDFIAPRTSKPDGGTILGLGMLLGSLHWWRCVSGVGVRELQAANKAGHTERARTVWPFHHNRKSGPCPIYAKKSRSFCQLILGNNQSLSSSFLTSVSNPGGDMRDRSGEQVSGSPPTR